MVQKQIGACVVKFLLIDKENKEEHVILPEKLAGSYNYRMGIAICERPGDYDIQCIYDMDMQRVPDEDLFSYTFMEREGCFVLKAE